MNILSNGIKFDCVFFNLNKRCNTRFLSSHKAIFTGSPRGLDIYGDDLHDHKKSDAIYKTAKEIFKSENFTSSIFISDIEQSKFNKNSLIKSFLNETENKICAIKENLDVLMKDAPHIDQKIWEIKLNLIVCELHSLSDLIKKKGNE